MTDIPARWKVVSQVPTTGQDSNGQFVRGRNVNYQLADGTTGSVFVPNASYTPDAVKAAIAADAATVAAIAGLTSDP